MTVVAPEPRQFFVVALVLGPYLPNSEQVFDPWGVRIFPVEADRIRELPKQRGVLGTMTELQYFHVRAPYTQVDAPWIVVIPRTATDANEAQTSAEVEVLPVLIAALHSLGGTPYRYEILRIEDPNDPDQARWTPMTTVGKGGPVWVDPLTSKRRETLRTRILRVSANATAAAAAEHLRMGAVLGDHPGPIEASGPAALLRYYLCIERVTQEVTAQTRRRRRAELDADRNRVAGALSSLLPTLDQAAAVTAIEEAARELRRAELGYADLEIRDAGHSLGIEHATVEVAVQFAAFRSKHLGHSSIPPSAKVAHWLEGPANRAFAVAAAYFGRYLDSLT